MSNKQAQDNESGEISPFNDFNFNANSIYLVSESPRRHKTIFIKKVKITPNGQDRVLLGVYRESKIPKGFSVVLTPDPSPGGSVVTDVTILGESEPYRLILHIANYGVRPIEAEVWQL